jgi:predicted nuclease of restriction endonuclease-like (RecB) superfamily
MRCSAAQASRDADSCKDCDGYALLDERSPIAYAELLDDLKARIHAARVRATLAVNRELILLYWQIGQGILTRQQMEGWGAKIIDRLADDLRREFPEMKGFSPRNLKYMHAFAEAWPDEPIVQQVAAQIPWFHNCILSCEIACRQWSNWNTN